MSEEYVTCPNCKTKVPKSKFCIYCGAELAETLTEEVPKVEKAVARPEAVKAEVEVKLEDTKKLMENIANLYLWKAKLVGALASGGVKRTAFDRLYDEYTRKLNELSTKRKEIIEGLEPKKRDSEDRLGSFDQRTDELQVRHKVGEISAAEYQEEMSKMNKERLEREVGTIGSELAILETIFGRRDPAEVKKIEAEIKGHRDGLRSLVENGVLDKDTSAKISADLEQTIALLNQVVGGRKEDEDKLKEQLDMLRARYAVGEVSLAEYEKQKKEIEGKLKEIWEG